MLFIDSVSVTFFNALGANHRDDIHLRTDSRTAERSRPNGRTPSGTICPVAAGSITSGAPQNWQIVAVSFDSLRAQYYAERNKFIELEKELGPKNPQYQMQKAKLDDLLTALQSEAKRTLAQKTKARGATVRAGTLSAIALALSTPSPAAAVPHHRGRLERTARDLLRSAE